MLLARSVAITCRISWGTDCGECTYEIDLLDGSTHAGFAPTDHFWWPDGTPVDEGDLPSAEVTPALIAAYFIGSEGGCVLISVAEGFVGLVDGASVRKRPDKTFIASRHDDRAPSPVDG